MKKTISINISGIIFNLDDDAYEVLKDYLQKLNLHFANSEEGREVIQDIEARIAELFQEKITDNKQVITIDDVNEVVEIMGSPDDFADELEEEEPQEQRRAKRKFYRDSDNKVLGGVCSGLAAFLDIDVLLVRILAIVFFIFSVPVMLILYIVLWIVIPEAMTAAQKLEMKGERVTVSNIEKTVKDEFENVKDNFNKFKKSKSAHRAKEVGNQIVDVLVEILRLGVRAFVVLLGIVLIVIGVFSLFGLFSAFVLKSTFIPFIEIGSPHFFIPEVFNIFANPASISMFSIGLFAVVVIPLVVIAYAGLKLLINFKTNDKLFLLTLLFAWIFGLLVMLGSVLFEGKNFARKEIVKERFEIEGSMSNIKLQVNDLSFEGDSYIERDDYIIIENDEEDKIMFIRPTLDIEKSYSDNYEIILVKSARGHNKNNAEDNAKSIQYAWKQNDSAFYFDSHYSIDENSKWRVPDLKIIVKVPEGKEIFLTEDIEELLDDVENVDHLWDFEMGDKNYMMLPEGLKEKEK